MKIECPDGNVAVVNTHREGLLYVKGFIAALECYGIWRDGVQVIGCMETPVKEVKEIMRKQLKG